MRKYLPLAFVAVALLLSLLAYDKLPDQVPSHWNSRGEVDGYSSRLVGAFLLPLAALAIWGILRIIPRFDPRRQNWTLSSDRVWERTHRVGGYAFAITGVVMLGTLFLAPAYRMPVTIAAAAGMTIFVIGYSYVAWRQEGGRGS